MLTDKQRKAVQMLFDGYAVQDAAAALGVHRCTLWRWSQRKEFAREWSQIQKDYVRDLLKRSGWYERRKDHRRQLRQIEKQLNDAAGRVRNGHTRALDAVWKEYKSCLFESEMRPSRRPGRGNKK